MSIVREACSIPQAYRDLLEGRTYAVLSTVMPSASAPISPNSTANSKSFS